MNERFIPDSLCPTCDRCGKQPVNDGIVIDTSIMLAVCFACLTDAERERLIRGERPFSEEGQR
jgi:hypothetical protein